MKPYMLPLAFFLVALSATIASAQDTGLPPYRIDPTDPSPEQIAAEKKREEQQAAEQKWAEEQTDKNKEETQEQHIERLIDLLVLADGDAKNKPVFRPMISLDGTMSDTQDNRRKFYRCMAAFARLMEYKAAAFPAMIKHLDDKRASTQFRNHYLANSVGDVCYWNIYYQLQDRPEGYSGYGYKRTGRDGKNHVQPYWEGTPFSKYYEKGGPPHNDLTKWLEANKDLSYPQMQIKCLTWLLEKEKAIGTPDAESYFINILPLEIQILKRRIESGEKVEAELAALERRQKEKRADEIPKELLPGKAN